MRRFKREFIAMTLSLTMILSGISMPQNATAAKKIKLNKKNVTIVTGKTVKLKLLNKKKSVKWSTSKKKVATVSKSGLVKGIKSGSAVITAKSAGKKYRCKVKVKTKSSAATAGTSVPLSTTSNPTKTSTPTGTTPPTGTKAPTGTQLPNPSSTPDHTTVPDPDDGDGIEVSTVVPTGTTTSTLMVGNLSVTLGMSSSQVKAQNGEPVRDGILSPQGFDTMVYNPEGAYTNYMLVYFKEDAVVGMATMSRYFAYSNILSGQYSVDQMKSAGFTAYDAGGRYSTTTADATVVALYDTNGSKQVIGVEVLDLTYKIDLFDKGEKCSYSDATLEEMRCQMRELANACRAIEADTSGSAFLNFYNDNISIAQTHSEYMAENDSEDGYDTLGSNVQERLKMYYNVTTNYACGESRWIGEADAFGVIAQTMLEADGYKRLTNTSYRYLSCGVASVVKGTQTYTYATLDFYKK